MSSFSGALSFILFLHKEQEGESQSILTGENNCSCLGFRCSVLPYGAGLLGETTSEIVVLDSGMALMDESMHTWAHQLVDCLCVCVSMLQMDRLMPTAVETAFSARKVYSMFTIGCLHVQTWPPQVPSGAALFAWIPFLKELSQHNQWVLLIHINRARCISLTNVLSRAYSDSTAVSTCIGFVWSRCTLSLEVSWSALLYPCTLTHSLCDKDNCCSTLSPSTTAKTQHALHFLFSTASDRLTNQSPYLTFFCKIIDLSSLWKGHIGRCFIFTLEAVILQHWSSSQW